jgi:hypothetical protein
LSITRRAGLAAYRRLVEAAPSVMTDGVDNRIAPFSARRANAKDEKKAAVWAMGLRTPSKWYATDGTGCFYYFRRRKVDVELIGYPGIGRLPVTVYGTTASQAYHRHGGQLTDRRPHGWLSAATIAAVNYGGFDGNSVRAWGWKSNEDLDLDVDLVDRLRAADPGPFHRDDRHARPPRSLASAYAEEFGRALAGAR